MSDKTTVARAFSTDGPECPFCGRRFTPDEPSYFNESGYDMDCDDCGKKFAVQVSCSWSWLCRPLRQEQKP